MEERCHERVFSLSEHSALLLLAPQSPDTFFSGSWWLMALECIWSVSLTMFIPKIDRISSEYWVQWVPLLLFLSFLPLFTHSPHSLQREFILLVCSVNEWSAEKTLSMMEKGCTHTPAKSLYHSLEDWITKINNWLQQRRDWTNKHTNIQAVKNPGFATACYWNCHKMLQDLLGR